MPRVDFRLNGLATIRLLTGSTPGRAPEFFHDVQEAAMTPDAARQQSHEFLARHQLPINETLPLLESPADLSPQLSIDVARRAAILTHIIGIGFGQPGSKMKQPLIDFGLLQFVSPNERLLLDLTTYIEQQKIDATWLVECMQAIGWCFQFVDLDPFSGCDDDLASHFPAPFTDPNDFIQSASLRPFSEIYRLADLHYRLHWATRDCRLKQLPCKIKEGVIKERRKALEWVIGVESNWDEIPMDT